MKFLDRLPHLILPTIVLGSSLTGGVMRYARNSMLESLNKDFIKTASKGLPEWRVNFIHGFRVAMTCGGSCWLGCPLVGGTVVIEIFQWPGMGENSVSSSWTRFTPYNDDSAIYCVSCFDCKLSDRYSNSINRS